MIPLGGKVTEGRGARIAANVDNDVELGGVDEGPEGPPVEAGAGLSVLPLVEIEEENPDDWPVEESCPGSEGGELDLWGFETDKLDAPCPPDTVPEDAAVSKPVGPVPPVGFPELGVTLESLPIGLDVGTSEEFVAEPVEAAVPVMLPGDGSSCVAHL